MHKEQSPSHSRTYWLDILSRFWAWLFLFAMILIFWIGNPAFMSLFNLQSILANMAILTIIAIGQTYVIISGGIDLSAGWIMGMVAVIAASTMNRFPEGTPIWIPLIGGFIVGLIAALIAGLVNGTLVARMNVPPFIATLGMAGIARGVGFLLSGGMPVPIYVKGLGFLGNGYLFYYHPNAGWSFLAQPPGLVQADLRNLTGILPFVVIVMIVVLVIAHLLLSRTRFGLHIYALGGNKEAASRAGIPVVRRTVSIYLLSATFAAIAGVVYNTRFTNGAANAGDALLLDTVAAVVIGGASLFGGAGTVIGTLIGALIISVLANGLVIMRVNPFWQFIAVGVVIIVAVLIDQAREKLTQ
ncbi:MAG: ABC transporter permease [Anaerolineales bacterium]|nr:ABC transporter permease [Anaerolineales bacterium]